jgi:uncharacterized membrane protein YfcA
MLDTNASDNVSSFLGGCIGSIVATQLGFINAQELLQMALVSAVGGTVGYVTKQVLEAGWNFLFKREKKSKAVILGI